MHRLSGLLLCGSWLLASVFFWFGASPFDAPGLMPDEICYLGWTRYLSGGDFYAMGSAGYCHPLYPALLAALTAFTETSAGTYRSALLFNSLLAGACLPVAAIIARRHLGASTAQAYISAGLAAAYPALSAYTKYSWPESLAYLLTLVFFWMWCRVAERPSTKREATLLAIAVIAYFAHARLLALPALLVCAALLRWLIDARIPHRRAVLAATAATLGAIALMSYIKAQATSSALPFETVVPFSALAPSSFTHLGRFFSKFGGNMLFTLLATAGLAWLPLAWCAKHPIKGPDARRFPLKVVAAPAILLGLVATGAVFIAASDRFDTYFYGRYAGPAIMLNSLVGAVLVMRFKSTRWMLPMLAMAFLCLFLLALAPSWSGNADYSRIHLAGFPYLFDWLKPIAGSSKFWLVLSTCVLLVAVAGAALPGMAGKWSLALPLSLFIAMHASGASDRTSALSKHLPTGTLSPYLASKECTIFWSPLITERVQNHQAYRIQYAYPNCRMTFERNIQCELLRPGTLLIRASQSPKLCEQMVGKGLALEPGLTVDVVGKTESAER